MQLDPKEERCAHQQAVQPMMQVAQQGDVDRAWEAGFPWAGLAPELVDLTVLGWDNEDA